MPIALILEMAADTYGERVALTADGRTLTYGGVRRAAAGGARLIIESGAQSLVFVGLNGPVVPCLLFSAGLAGVPLTPLNYRLSPDQLADQIAELPNPLIVVDHTYVDTVRPVLPSVITTDEWIANSLGADPLDEHPVNDDKAAVILFTSGTTSKPKGVVLKHEHLVNYVLQTVEFASAPEDSAALVSVPPYHIAGMGTVLTNIYAGRRMAYLPNFTGRGWLDLVRSENVSNAMLVPTMLARILDELGDTIADTPSLRALAYGGARMPRPVLERALRQFPDVDFVNAYGLTETSSTVAVLGPEDHRRAFTGDPVARRRLDSVGRLVPGVEGIIRGPGGTTLATGEVGELWVRGPQVSGTYVGIGSVLDVDGWFPTKDRASLDPDGYLFIEGRSDDTIIRGGENISPSEIEVVLVEHPSVSDVAVFGADDDEWGERIVAVVVVTGVGESPSAEGLRQYVRQQLRGSRTPDDVVFAESLPYTATGKLLRNKLKTGYTGTTV
ncbi:class I adenylate-forming enzyme family protein [Gordonia insulae]|uniref:2-succinylbenzoate--CoA ligase n=1 Tax=Gordonia insulae TaxID=2420509 RepID=A0A3G8JMR9_9ACTN|nr:class I adenylate-forming enzyme family protein [Gordonia insulae]AZG45480.1 2-succinylbenzoate--CoA ligase [Gordonia insulae]